jgi:hypothetical protein
MMQTDESMDRDDELERRLRAYAEARLSSRPGASSRMRAVVLASAAGQAVAPVPAAVHRRPARVLIGLLAAAAVVLVVAGGALAFNGPGQPFYGPRLWLEAVTLPSDPGARSIAMEERLEDRLAEARRAAAAGDAAAVAAALDAYRDELAQLVEAGGAIGLQERLATHLVVLGTLLDGVPPSARDAISQAIDRSSRAIDQVEASGGGGNGGGGNGGGGNGGGGNGGGGNGGQGGGGNGGHGGGGNGQGPAASPSHGPDSSPAKPSPKPKPSQKPAPSIP